MSRVDWRVRITIQKMANAVSPVISVTVAVLVVTSIMTGVLFVGMPYVEEQRSKSVQADVGSQFDSMLDALDDLTESGDTTVAPITSSEGGFIESKVASAHLIDKPLDDPDSQTALEEEGDRTIAMYSIWEGYNFTASGLNDTDNEFKLEMIDGNVTEARAYWLDDNVSGPLLYYWPESHNFNNILKGSSVSTEFEIWNGGIETLDYSLYEDRDWLEVIPMEGDSTGEHDTIKVMVNSGNLDAGEQSYSISITSNGASSNGNESAGGNGNFKIYFNVIPENQPPTITNDSGNVSICEGGSVILWLNATDDLTPEDQLDAKVTINSTYTYDMTYNSIMSRWEYEFNDNHEITNYTLTVYDEGGLSNTSGPYDILPNTPPIVFGIPDQTLQGKKEVEDGFAPILLDRHVDDPDNDASEMNWTYEYGCDVDMVPGPYPSAEDDDHLIVKIVKEIHDGEVFNVAWIEIPHGTLDQNNSIWFVGEGWFTDTSLAQSFKAEKSGELARVKLHLRHMAGGTPNITVGITDSLFMPTFQVWTNISGFSNSEFSWITATFDTPATIYAGLTYYIVLQQTSGGTYLWNSTCCVQGCFDTYPNGTAYIDLGGWKPQNDDFLFKTYVEGNDYWIGTDTITFIATDPCGLSDNDTATFTVLPAPCLCYYPTVLNFIIVKNYCIPVSKTFYIYNAGSHELTYSLTDNRPWLEVSPTSGSHIRGEPDDEIEVSIKCDSVPEVGNYTGTITINSNGWGACGTSGSTGSVLVNLEVTELTASLKVEPEDFIATELGVGGTCEELNAINIADHPKEFLTLSISNDGDDPMSELIYSISTKNWSWREPGEDWERYLMPVGSEWCSFLFGPIVKDASKDARIMEAYKTTNYGDGLELRVDPKWRYNPLHRQRERTLVYMDVSEPFPEGGVVYNATLGLYYIGYIGNNPNGRTHQCYEVAKEWVERDYTGDNGIPPDMWYVNWKYRDAVDIGGMKVAIMWDPEGGEYRTPFVDEATVPNPNNWVSWDVTGSIIDFKEKIPTTENYGWFIKDSDEGTYLPHCAIYSSKEDSSYPDPKLEIYYTTQNHQNDEGLKPSDPADELTVLVDATNLEGGHEYRCELKITSNAGNKTILVWFYADQYEPPCFLAGTKVAMADGSYKNIEDIKVGEKVKSYDEQTEEVVSGRVTQVFHRSPEEMTDYYLVINDALKVTPNHRMYSNGEWVAAGDLEIGDSLFTSENMGYTVYSIEEVYERHPTFDLGVERFHTYFVSIDGVDVLVHNDAPSDYDEPIPDGVYHWEILTKDDSDFNSTKPWPFTGTVCIYLYNDTGTGTVLFGKIWLFDSDSLTYSISSSTGKRDVTMSNGGVIYSDSGYIKREPNVDEKDGTFWIRIVQTVASSSFSAGGTSGYELRISSSLYKSCIRETKPVYCLRLQFWDKKEHDDVWLRYFKNTYKFEELPSELNTLFYESDEGVRLTLSHQVIEFNLQ